MPKAAFIDFHEIDLSRVVADKAEVQEFLRQRGRFQLLDGILHFDLENDLIVGFKDVRSDEWWAPDHIPGRPLYPGALMIESAAQLSTYAFLHLQPEHRNSFIGFTGVDGARFRGLVEPDCRLILAAKLDRVRNTMFNYRVQGFVERSFVFECVVMGMLL